MLSRRNFAATLVGLVGSLGILGRIRFSPSRGGPRGRRRLLGVLKIGGVDYRFEENDDSREMFAFRDGEPMEYVRSGAAGEHWFGSTIGREHARIGVARNAREDGVVFFGFYRVRDYAMSETEIRKEFVELMGSYKPVNGWHRLSPSLV